MLSTFLIGGFETNLTRWLFAPLLAPVAFAAHAQPGEPAAPAASETEVIAIPIGGIAAEAEAIELCAEQAESVMTRVYKEWASAHQRP